MTMTLGFIVLALACLLSFVGGILLVVAGFRESTKWGLLNLFVPGAALVFTFTRWPEAKKGFLMSLVGGVLAPVAAMLIVGGAAASIGDQMEEQMALEMQRQVEEMQKRHAAETQIEQAQGVEPAPRAVEAASYENAPAYAKQARGPSAPQPVAEAELPDVGVPLSGGGALGSVDPNDAGRYLGERFKFVGADGSLFFGELLAVEGSHLRVKREMQGGTVEYGIAKNELTELRPIY